MRPLQRYVLALSRVLVAIIFLLSGLGIISQASAAKDLVDRGAPAGVVPFLMLCASSLEVVAGFGLAFGIYPRLAAVALLAFLFAATLAGHAFWQVAGTASFTPQLLNFLNTAMAGGLLFIAATEIPTNTSSAHFAVKRRGTVETREGFSRLVNHKGQKMNSTHEPQSPENTGGTSISALNWMYALDDSSLLEGRMVPAYPQGVNVVLARVGGAVYAVSGTFTPHAISSPGSGRAACSGSTRPLGRNRRTRRARAQTARSPVSPLSLELRVPSQPLLKFGPSQAFPFSASETPNSIQQIFLSR